MKGTRRYYWTLILAAVACAWVCAALRTSRAQGPPARNRLSNETTQGQAAPGVLKMRIEGDQVSAEIRETLLQRVLEELADRTGTIFEIESQLNPPVSVVLYRVSLQEA